MRKDLNTHELNLTAIDRLSEEELCSRQTVVVASRAHQRRDRSPGLFFYSLSLCWQGWLVLLILFAVIINSSVQATSHYTPKPFDYSCSYHTTTKPLFDYEFASAITSELQNNYWGLQIVMGQCNSGGFIYWLDADGVDMFSIATGARWDLTTYSVDWDKNGLDYFLYLWVERVEEYPNSSLGGAYPAWNYARNNYCDLRHSYRPNSPCPVQDPQYFSRPDSQDGETPNAGCWENYIILVLGDNLSWHHWKELERIHHLMSYTYNYREDRIYVYAGHQKLPDGSSAPSWVDGDGSKENILNTTSMIGARLSGMDKIFIWFFGHGNLWSWFDLVYGGYNIPPSERQRWRKSLNAEFSSSSHKSAMLRVIASGVEENGIEVSLNGVLLGCLEEGTGTMWVPVPPGLYIEGENIIEFQSKQGTEATISEVWAGSGYPPDEEWIGDLNSSGDVDMVDFAMFALHWLEKDCGTCGGADLTGEGRVDFSDLKKLTENWLAGIE